MAEVVFALPELDLLVVFRVFMVSSSLINYKVPEFYRCISIGNTSTTRSDSTSTSRLSASSLPVVDRKRLISACNA
jgi:hypothetical protein